MGRETLGTQRTPASKRPTRQSIEGSPARYAAQFHGMLQSPQKAPPLTVSRSYSSSHAPSQESATYAWLSPPCRLVCSVAPHKDELDRMRVSTVIDGRLSRHLQAHPRHIAACSSAGAGGIRHSNHGLPARTLARPAA